MGLRKVSPLVPGAVLGLLVLSACTGSSSAGSAALTNASPSPSPAAASSVTGVAADLQAQYESVIKRVLPSVVEISTSTGLGSGVIYDSAGDIVTNYHVVGAAKTFQVTLSNHATPVTGTLVGTFPAGDLAMIKVSGQKDLHPATLADSSQVQLGEIVLAMGNPLGLYSSVTNGIVSAVGRTLTEPQTADSPGATLPDSIQTSAAINPGNSGGALVDLAGRVVGIPTLAATNQEEGGAAPGIGFAIPSNTVRTIGDQLAKTGKVTNTHRAALGIEAATVTQGYGQEVAGAGVASVTPGGAAAKAGIAAGDIITKINSTPIPDVQSLSTTLAELNVGQSVSVSYLRGGTSHTVRVTLGELPAG
jgi:putative serine protease PepD